MNSNKKDRTYYNSLFPTLPLLYPLSSKPSVHSSTLIEKKRESSTHVAAFVMSSNRA